jgi:hypothetical protein
MSEVGEFFDEQHKSEAYKNLKKLTRGVDEAAARIMNREVSGRALSIGGTWEGYAPGPQLKSLTCLDLSEETLKSYAPEDAKTAVGDLYTYEFSTGMFDSIVFALILHHVAQGSWARCRERVRTALSRAKQWLAPGGKLFVIEYCPALPWMPVQRLALPATKAFLGLAKQPLVVMHEKTFYEGILKDEGFSSVEARLIQAPGTSDWTLFPVFMAVPWLKMPLKFYPRMHIITGTKP